MNDQNPSPWVLETRDETFEHDVIARSTTVPVVVDFWADWCQPCRMLGPILDELAEEFGGSFMLVKANTELCPQAAANFRVQSIPAVYGVRDGRVVDGFLGARPSDEIRQWIVNLLPTLAEMLMREGADLVEQDVPAAIDKFQAAQAADERFYPAQIAAAEALRREQEDAAAAEIMEHLAARGFLEPEAERVKARLELHAHASVAAPVATCRERVAAAPDQRELQLDLAAALAGSAPQDTRSGDIAHQAELVEALELCLNVIRQEKGDLRERARRTMVDIFRLLPDDSEVVTRYRRNLAMSLF